MMAVGFNLRRWLSLAVLLGLTDPIPAQSATVTAELRVPPAEVYVIGDDIPLMWQFTNRESEPLAFLWEGCCRLNGRLDVTRAGQSLEPIPPGSSLAHQFARAEVLEPGQPGEFKTLLSDWVQLDKTGRYFLQGRYVGVLPSQQPQVPSTVNLWRGETRTDPIPLTVLSPDDYLTRRSERSDRRGLRLELAGPDRLPALGAASLEITFHNLNSEPQSIFWPGPAQLWILNERSERLGVRFIDQPTEEITLPPLSRATRAFSLSADDLLDAPFGTYRVFIDHAGKGPDQPRVPSNAVALDWNLNADQVGDLVAKAAEGPSRGLRNPALKRLRVYLGLIRTQLAALNQAALDAEAAELAGELKLGACLKSFAPVPGAVEFKIAFRPNGDWVLAESDVLACLNGADAASAAQLDRILAVRRHLGWSVKLLIEPSPETRLGDIMKSVAGLEQFSDRLAGAVSARVVLPEQGMTNLVNFQTNYIPANLVIRLGGDTAQSPLGVARRTAEPGRPRWLNRFSRAELETVAFTPLPDAEALDDWLTGEHIESPQITVLADSQLTWKRLNELLDPVMRRGWSVELAPEL